MGLEGLEPRAGSGRIVSLDTRRAALDTLDDELGA